MVTKSIISLVFVFQAIINDANVVIAQTPRPTQQHFKCNKYNFRSDYLLIERNESFAYVYKKFQQSKPYTGHESGPVDAFVWSTALCPPNIKTESCLECLNNTIPYLKKNCPKNKDGAAWTVLPTVVCMARYADYRFRTQLDVSYWVIFNSPPNHTVANAIELEKGVNNLADKLKGPAAGGDHMKKYSSGSVTYGPGSRNLYGSMQCTSDLKKDDCLKCLSDATNEMHRCCSKKRTLTAQTLSFNCYFWFAHANFLPKRLLTNFVTSP